MRQKYIRTYFYTEKFSCKGVMYSYVMYLLPPFCVKINVYKD